MAFRVGVTRDFLGHDGSITFGDIGLGVLEEAGIAWNFLPGHAPEILPEHVAGFDGLLVLAPRISAATLAGNPDLAVVARFGVGYDSVDVAACTRLGIALTITPDGVRRPVAVAAMTLLLALAHKLLLKDRMTREGRWGDKLQHMGVGVTGRTVGVVGLGNIGLELCSLAHPFGMRVAGYDPYPKPADPRMAGVTLMDLDALLAESDFVCVCCALTPETNRLIDARRLALMKRSAFLINVARGPVVDQEALTQALRSGAIQGAGLDVFETEPVPPDEPLLKLDNTIVAPHGLCWTDECFRGIGYSACRSIAAIAAGETPDTIVNREVADSPLFQAKLRRTAS